MKKKGTTGCPLSGHEFHPGPHIVLGALVSSVFRLCWFLSFPSSVTTLTPSKELLNIPALGAAGDPS